MRNGPKMQEPLSPPRNDPAPPPEDAWIGRYEAPSPASLVFWLPPRVVVLPPEHAFRVRGNVPLMHIVHTSIPTRLILSLPPISGLRLRFALIIKTRHRPLPPPIHGVRHGVRRSSLVRAPNQNMTALHVVEPAAVITM